MNFTQEEEMQIMKDMDEMQEEIHKERLENEKIVDEAKKELSKSKQKHLEYELEESEGGFNFKIVDKPLGENQKCKGYEFWVNQTCNGGYTGDMFEGDCYFKLGENRYLMWAYAL